MPARTTGSTSTMTTTSAPSKRFELPALEFKFASLTDGTDIPPPPPSPIAEKPPKIVATAKPKPKAMEALKSGDIPSSKSNGIRAVSGAITTTTITAPGSQPSRGRPDTTGSLKRRVDQIPGSPTLSARSGSIRRLFSRNLLNAAYANGEPEGHGTQGTGPGSMDISHGSPTRPDSRSTASVMDGRKARRSSSWFHRLRGGLTEESLASRRSSMIFHEEAKPLTPLKSTAPPPPMIPELDQLKAKVEDDDGSLGTDLFKNIK